MNKFFLIFIFAAVFMSAVFAEPETAQEPQAAEGDDAEFAKFINENPRMKELFDEFEKNSDENEKSRILSEIMKELGMNFDEAPEAEAGKQAEAAEDMEL